MRDDEHMSLPLFAWRPECRLIPFPMTSRVGKIRETAIKMLDKPTDRHADYYRRQVTEGLLQQFDKIGLDPKEADWQLHAFWQSVQDEMNRLCYAGASKGNDPRGAA